jgi:hypothetical protein
MDIEKNRHELKKCEAQLRIWMKKAGTVKESMKRNKEFFKRN